MARRYGGNPAAVIILIAGDLAAAILILWIAFVLLNANPASRLDRWVHHAANWLSAWSRDLFLPADAKVRTAVNYGLPAVIYLLLAQLAASRVNRLRPPK